MCWETVRQNPCSILEVLDIFENFKKSCVFVYVPKIVLAENHGIYQKLEKWANAQRDGRLAEYRWHPLFNTAKFG